MLLLIIMLLKDVRLILVRLDLDKMGESQKIRNYELFDTSLSPVISFLNSLRRGHGNDVLVTRVRCLCSSFSRVTLSHIPEHQVAAFVWQTPKYPHLWNTLDVSYAKRAF